MNERNLFKELKQGFEETQLHQQGKITLRTETLKEQRKGKRLKQAKSP